MLIFNFFRDLARNIKGIFVPVKSDPLTPEDMKMLKSSNRMKYEESLRK